MSKKEKKPLSKPEGSTTRKEPEIVPKEDIVQPYFIDDELSASDSSDEYFEAKQNFTLQNTTSESFKNDVEGTVLHKQLDNIDLKPVKDNDTQQNTMNEEVKEFKYKSTDQNDDALEAKELVKRFFQDLEETKKKTKSPEYRNSQHKVTRKQVYQELDKMRQKYGISQHKYLSRKQNQALDETGKQAESGSFSQKYNTLQLEELIEKKVGRASREVNELSYTTKQRQKIAKDGIVNNNLRDELKRSNQVDLSMKQQNIKDDEAVKTKESHLMFKESPVTEAKLKELVKKINAIIPNDMVPLEYNNRATNVQEIFNINIEKDFMPQLKSQQKRATIEYNKILKKASVAKKNLKDLDEIIIELQEIIQRKKNLDK